MPNYSIMIPTRRRFEMLKNLLESIKTNTENKNNIEVIIMHDNDDSLLLQNINIIKEYNNFFSLKIEKRDRSYSINNDYYNYMATKVATGDWLIAVNDDTRFINYAWDNMGKVKIEKYLENKPDGIFYGVVNDKEIERKRNEHYWFSCFPMISKKAVNALGFFFDPLFYKDGADWDIFGTYQGLNRVIDLRSEIIIEHISFRSGRRKRDELDCDVFYFPERGKEPSCGQNTRKHINFLTDYINTYSEKKYEGINYLQLVEKYGLDEQGNIKYKKVIT